MSRVIVEKYEYISVSCPEESKRTRQTKYDIFNNRSGKVIGTVAWFSRWKQWVFLPRSETIWSSSCLDDISDFLDGLSEE